MMRLPQSFHALVTQDGQRTRRETEAYHELTSPATRQETRWRFSPPSDAQQGHGEMSKVPLDKFRHARSPRGRGGDEQVFVRRSASPLRRRHCNTERKWTRQRPRRRQKQGCRGDGVANTLWAYATMGRAPGAATSRALNMPASASARPSRSQCLLHSVVQRLVTLGKAVSGDPGQG